MKRERDIDEAIGGEKDSAVQAVANTNYMFFIRNPGQGLALGVPYFWMLLSEHIVTLKVPLYETLVHELHTIHANFTAVNWLPTSKLVAVIKYWKLENSLDILSAIVQVR